MAKVFGKANDFYRIRILNLREEDEPKIQWNDDILLRKPANEQQNLENKFIIEIVNLDTGQKIALDKYSKLHEAKKQIIIMEEDLNELTKIQFEEKYDFGERLEA